MRWSLASPEILSSTSTAADDLGQIDDSSIASSLIPAWRMSGPASSYTFLSSF